MNRILLFSRPIRSGKTTELMRAIPFLGKVGGILCPDKDDLRFLFSIPGKTWYPLQVSEALEGKTLEIGRFHFLFDGFETARNCLIKDARSGYDWLIVDEVGRLEMRDKQGLEPALTSILEGYKTGVYTGNLLLVVRDYLVAEVRDYYGLSDSPLINDLTTWTQK